MFNCTALAVIWELLGDRHKEAMLKKRAFFGKGILKPTTLFVMTVNYDRKMLKKHLPHIPRWLCSVVISSTDILPTAIRPITACLLIHYLTAWK
jgi:hypothetical protein